MLFHPYLHLPDSPSKLKVHAGFPCLAVILPRFLLNYIAQGETTLATTASSPKHWFPISQEQATDPKGKKRSFTDCELETLNEGIFFLNVQYSYIAQYNI